MRVLLHVCCAPCSAHPVPALRALGHEVAGWFFNPNIHPAGELALRREALAAFAPRIGLPVTFADAEPALWEEAVAGDGGDRCRACFDLRLRAAAREARRRGDEAFSSTLFFSRYLKHELARAVGEAVAREEGVAFLYRDFRRGWDEGWRAYGPTGLHRQWYCGCRLSRAEREVRRAELAAARGRAS